ncbi:MAG: glycine--tRNA ligase [Candidatus Hydrothermarchaeales archaeon]
MDKHEKVMELALRRGFLWPSYEIYGGTSGFYDYGPLGAMLKKKIEDEWRRLYCVEQGFLEISTPTIAPEDVFVASGHVKNFIDPMVECEKCKEVYKADQLIEAKTGETVTGHSFEGLNKLIKGNDIKCLDCSGKLGEVWSYNLMFKTHIGPGSKTVGYLRPETAQGMFTLFNRLYAFHRKKLPFGVAQLGRAYRNEISPRQGVIRLREFSQAEVEVFVHPDEKTHPDFARYAKEKLRLVPQDAAEVRVTAEDAVKDGLVAHELLCYHIVLINRFLEGIGLPKEDLRFRQHLKSEIAHYAADCWDAEIQTERFGWIEVVGIADRTNYDLISHEKHSGVELNAFIQYEVPKIVKKRMLTPKMARIGKEFKERATEIVQNLRDASNEDMDFFEEKGFLELQVKGEKIKLGSESIELKQVEEKVHGEKITPHVIEPSYGIDRILYCLLEKAYTERDDRKVMSFKTNIAPIDIGVFPLVSKDELNAVALKILNELKSLGFYVIYDGSDTIGRRYSRVDEIGVPFAVTVDFDTLKDDSVTVRERDSMKQVRVKIGKLPKLLDELR